MQRTNFKDSTWATPTLCFNFESGELFRWRKGISSSGAMGRARIGCSVFETLTWSGFGWICPVEDGLSSSRNFPLYVTFEHVGAMRSLECFHKFSPSDFNLQLRIGSESISSEWTTDSEAERTIQQEQIGSRGIMEEAGLQDDNDYVFTISSGMGRDKPSRLRGEAKPKKAQETCVSFAALGESWWHFSKNW